eukprot:s997_g8.t1
MAVLPRVARLHGGAAGVSRTSQPQGSLIGASAGSSWEPRHPRTSLTMAPRPRPPPQHWACDGWSWANHAI